MENKQLTQLGLITFLLVRSAWENASELEREVEALVRAAVPKNTPKEARGRPQKRSRGRPKNKGRIEVGKIAIPAPVLSALERYAEDRHTSPIKYVDQMVKVKAGDLVKYKGVGWSSLIKTDKILQQHGFSFADSYAI